MNLELRVTLGAILENDLSFAMSKDDQNNFRSRAHDAKLAIKELDKAYVKLRKLLEQETVDVNTIDSGPVTLKLVD